MRRGYTLIETMLALVILGLALGVALPRATALRNGWAVEEAAQTLVQAHRRARIAAVLWGHPLILLVSPDSLRLTTLADSVIWAAPGPLRSGVSMTGGLRKLTFTPVGITAGVSNASYRFTAGAAIRTVVLSRLGRVRLTRGP
jgi:prepilin-type N-terminal cleavage/methylation domain-containing protein